MTTPSRRRMLCFARGLERLEDRTTPNVAFAIDASGLNLVTFDTNTPGTSTSKAISGLGAGEIVNAIDFRPFDGQLYALGTNVAGTSGHLYRLDTGTGVATQVGATTFTFSGATDFGFDFNPVVDRIRVTTDAGENLRLNPNDGTLAGSDTKLAPDVAESAVAYDRNINQRPDTTTGGFGAQTTLFGINPTTDQLVRIGGVDGSPSPNGGATTNIGPLGVDAVFMQGFDIVGDTGTAFAALRVFHPVITASELHTIDLATGAATLVGKFASDVRALAVLPSTAKGTSGNDLIEVAPNPTVPQSVLITINGVPKGAFGNTGDSPVSIQGLDGDDTIRLTNGLQLPGGSADGGAGTDTLDYSLWTTGVTVNLSDWTQNEVVFRAVLDGLQEVPPTTTKATGTATVVLNATAKTYDLRMDVAGIARGDVTGSHFHSGAVGVDGPIFLDLGDGKLWTTTASGIARAVAGAAFPDAKIVDLLNGQTYLNVHTTANPGGEIRGQLEQIANVSNATGFASSGGKMAVLGFVTNFENVTGGSGDDLLMGTDGANLLRGGLGTDILLGRGGNDTLVGDKGADQLFGDTGNDTLVWNDGDGSDLMEGGAGTDTVQVNGGTADETFTMGPNGDRTTFTRTTGKNFTLDINAENLTLNGNAGIETVTVAPSKLTAFTINGGDPTSAPGDRLALNVAGVSGSKLTTPSGTDQGQYSFDGGFLPVTFNSIEGLAPLSNPFAVGAGGGSPVARVFGPTGASLFDVTVFDASFTGGVRVAMGDVNGDGTADLIVGTGPGVATHVRVLDGITKAELFAIDPFEASFTGGVFVAAGDVNGDGLADFAISPDEGGGPRVRVFSGAKFAQIADFLGIEDPAFRGGARAALGDISGDGLADLIVAAGFGGGPRIAGFSGASLSTTPVKLFGDFLAFEPALRNGTYVAAGDIDGDGKADLIAGGGPGGGPRVTVFDGTDLLSNVQTRSSDFFAGDVTNRGGIRVAAKNLDGDTKADLIVGAGTGAGSRVTAYAGSSFTGGTPPELFAADAFPGFTGGVFVG